VLGAVALALTAVGLYGLMAFSMTQRTHEIGIRMALGAGQADVLELALRQGMVLTLAGLLAGIAASVAVTRLASGLLVNVSATDPTIFAGAVLGRGWWGGGLARAGTFYANMREWVRHIVLRCQIGVSSDETRPPRDGPAKATSWPRR
jgi:ABC-type antimicrobial peptide transport system permease subunit